MGEIKLPFKFKILVSLVIAFCLSTLLYKLTDGISPIFSQKKALAILKTISDFKIVTTKKTTQSSNQIGSFTKYEARTVTPTTSSPKPTSIFPTSKTYLSPTAVKNYYPTLTPITNAYPTVFIPTQVIIPTEAVDPTKVKTPKPSKTPKPTQIVLQAVRPGKNFDEVIENVSQIICIPKAMLRATLQEEYGAWLGKIEADWTNYNTYRGADGDYTGSQQIMGVMQMMGDTWQRIKTIVGAKVGGADLSIGVTYDAILGAGYHLWNISTYRGKDCTDWPLQNIAKAACKYGGGCTMGAHNYCVEVCQYYNQFGGQHKDCSRISKMLSNDGKCTIISK